MPDQITFREAKRSDLEVMVGLLAADPLGAQREHYALPLPEAYVAAFDTIDADPNHLLLICELEGELAGFFQLSFLPNLSYVGGWRAQIEGVRVAEAHRRKGLGKRMFEHAIARSKEKGCHLLQLTTDKRRPDAVTFYTSLGFVASHEGMKLKLA